MLYVDLNIFVALEKAWKYIQIERSSRKVTGTREEKQCREEVFICIILIFDKNVFMCYFVIKNK